MGSCAAYYPEANPLAPLYAHDAMSFTPSFKATPDPYHPFDRRGGRSLIVDAR